MSNQLLRDNTRSVFTTSRGVDKQPHGGDTVFALLAFLAAFGAAMLFNWPVVTAANSLVFDSVHYFQSTQLFYQFLCGDKTHLVDLARNLNLDGPVLPLLGAGAYFISGAAPDANNLHPLLFLQSLLHGITCSLVYLLCVQVCKTGATLLSQGLSTNEESTSSKVKLASLICALFFAVNSAGLISCGRYLTETLTTTLLVGFVYCLSRIKDDLSRDHKHELRTCLKFLYSGLLAASVILVKSALVPAVFAATIVMATWSHGWRHSFGRFAVFLAGLTIVFLIPGIFNLSATGHFQILPDRLPGWNLALGSDVETDGWSAIPVPPLLELNYFDKPLNILSGIYKEHPLEFVNLTCRKVIRLFGTPWNDFAAHVPPGMDFWTFTHQFSEITGLCALLMLAALTAVRRSACVGCICAAVFLAHLVFVPFESIPRYAYSATPYAVILAAYFLTQLNRRAFLTTAIVSSAVIISLQLDLVPVLIKFTKFQTALAIECTLRAAGISALFLLASFETARTINRREAIKPILLVACLLSAATFVLSMAFATVQRNTGEWVCQLSGNIGAQRVIKVEPAARHISSKPDWVAILIDGKQIEDSSISFNDHLLKSKSSSIYEIPNAYRYQQTLLHTVESEAAAERVSVQNLRQWRLVKIPTEWLHNGWNKVCVRPKSNCSVTIYGDYRNSLDNRLLLPSLNSFAVCKVQCGTAQRDARPFDPIGFPASTGKCELLLDNGGDGEHSKSSQDLSPASGLQSGHYRIYLLAAYRKQIGPDYQVDGMTFSNRFVTLF